MSLGAHREITKTNTVGHGRSSQIPDEGEFKPKRNSGIPTFGLRETAKDCGILWFGGVAHMGMMALRNALRLQRNVFRNSLLTLAAITTLIVSLLVMHSLNPGHGMSGGSVTTNQQASHHGMQLAYGTGELAGAKACGGVCSPDHCLTAASCPVVSLTPVVPVGTARVIAVLRPFQRSAESNTARLSALSVPDPPSLLFLSISRT